MSQTFTSSNIPWAGPDFKTTKPKAFYIEHLTITCSDLEVLDPEEASKIPYTILPVDMTWPLFSGKPFHVYRANKVSMEEPPSAHSIKYICTFWSTKVSITNEKMYLWREVKASAFDPSVLGYVLSKVDVYSTVHSFIYSVAEKYGITVPELHLDFAEFSKTPGSLKKLEENSLYSHW